MCVRGVCGGVVGRGRLLLLLLLLGSSGVQRLRLLGTLSFAPAVHGVAWSPTCPAHIGTAAQCVVIQPVPCIAGDVLACSDLSFRAVKGVLVTVLACAAAAVARAAIADGAMDSGWSCSRMRDQLLPGAFAGTAASMAGDTSAGRGSSTLSSGLDSVSSEQAPATGDGCATDSVPALPSGCTSIDMSHVGDTSCSSSHWDFSAETVVSHGHGEDRFDLSTLD